VIDERASEAWRPNRKKKGTWQTDAKPFGNGGKLKQQKKLVALQRKKGNKTQELVRPPTKA